MPASTSTVAASSTAMLVALIAATALRAAPALASNLVHPRTPVVWPDAPCIATVDRSESPTFAFDYEIPAEDTQLSFDEFEDSRRHQFLGFCRQWPAGRPPPRYVSVSDLDRAITAGFETSEILGDPEATLETSVLWAGCWTRITADDDRRPITDAAAAEPVVWDLAAIDAGTWLIAGYTWEPPYNLWSRAPWVLRVVDAPEPIDTQAAVSLADTADTVYFDEVLELPICVDAEPGSTLTIEWAASKPDVLEWTAQEEFALDGPGELSVPFAPPPASFGATIVLRAIVEQPVGAVYEGHSLSPVIVFAPPSEGEDGDTGDSAESDSDSGDSEGDSEGDSGSGETGPSVAGANGGRCSLGPERGNLPTFAVLLGLSWLACARRRRG
jgi:hypothetical protein